MSVSSSSFLFLQLHRSALSLQLQGSQDLVARRKRVVIGLARVALHRQTRVVSSRMLIHPLVGGPLRLELDCPTKKGAHGRFRLS